MWVIILHASYCKLDRGEGDETDHRIGHEVDERVYGQRVEIVDVLHHLLHLLLCESVAFGDF